MRWFRFILFPLALLYGLVTVIRNFLFDRGVLKSTRFEIPVIAVGNLSTGGTGKTPQIEYLIGLLKNRYRIAILSRGYKRKSKGFLLLNDTHLASEVGDEPLQFFRKFKEVTVAVAADRVNGISQLLKNENPPEVILLDDALQHRKVKAGFYVLLTTYDNLYSDDYLLPVGNLRESGSGARRANFILITKCPHHLEESEQKKIIQKLKANPQQQIFFSTISYGIKIKGKTQELTITDLKKQPFILITGIANPSPLVAHLNHLGLVYEHLKYRDHHHFSKKDISYIQRKSNRKYIVTTEKDYVRLADKMKNVFFIPIKTHFLTGKEAFDTTILRYITNTLNQ